MPKNHKNFRIYAYRRKSGNETSQNNTIINPQTQTYNKSFHPIKSQNIYTITQIYPINKQVIIKPELTNYIPNKSKENNKNGEIIGQNPTNIVKKSYRKDDDNCCSIF